MSAFEGKADMASTPRGTKRGIAFALGQISADDVNYFAVLIKGPREGKFRITNFCFVAALESSKQSLFGVPKPCRSHTESWKVRVIFDAHDCGLLCNRGRLECDADFRVVTASAADAIGSDITKEAN